MIEANLLGAQSRPLMTFLCVVGLRKYTSVRGVSTRGASGLPWSRSLYIIHGDSWASSFGCVLCYFPCRERRGFPPGKSESRKQSLTGSLTHLARWRRPWIARSVTIRHAIILILSALVICTLRNCLACSLGSNRYYSDCKIQNMPLHVIRGDDIDATFGINQRPHLDIHHFSSYSFCFRTR